MKKLFLIGLSLVLFIACQNKPQRYFAESAETTALKSGIEAYESGDWDKWQSHFVDTAKIFVNSTKPLNVSDRAKELQTMAGAMASYGFNHDKEYIEMVLDKDDETWVYYWATHKSTVAATKKELIIPVHLAVQFVDGKIVEEHVYYDGTSMNSEFEAIASMSESDLNKMDAIAQVVDGWNTHDISNLKALSVQNLTRSSNGTLEVNTIKEYETFMNSFVTAFPDFKVKVNNVDINDNKIYIAWTVTGTHNGDFMGNAPTGKKIETDGFSIWTLNANGKFVSEEAYYDNLTVYGKLGITPPLAN